jgi:hypothetical protein
MLSRYRILARLGSGGTDIVYCPANLSLKEAATLRFLSRCSGPGVPGAAFPFFVA